MRECWGRGEREELHGLEAGVVDGPRSEFEKLGDLERGNNYGTRN